MSGVSQRPYVLLSCAMSVDGYIDDTRPDRLLFSNDADFDRVDGQRALADAVLVGATTIRHDNPRLVVRSPARRSARQERGLPVSPAKVTITGSGNLDPQASFFTAGAAEVCKLVYCASPAVRAAQDVLSTAPATSIIDAALADDSQLLIAPFFFGAPDAPRFVGAASFPWDSGHRMTLDNQRPIG